MSPVNTLFPDAGFTLGALDALLEKAILTEEEVKSVLSGIADENFGHNPKDRYERFDIEEKRARLALTRLGSLELATDALECITLIAFDGGARIYEVLEGACGISTGGEADYYEVGSLEGITHLPNLVTLDLDGYGCGSADLSLEWLKGHPSLQELRLSRRCTELHYLSSLPCLASVNFMSPRLPEPQFTAMQEMVEALRSRGVDIQGAPTLLAPRPAAKPTPQPAPSPAPNPPPAPTVEPHRITRRNGSHWETVEEGRTAYVDIRRHEVVVGSHHGSGITDNAGACSREAFLAGQYHDTVRAHHGEAVLQEVLAALRPASTEGD